ncbi:MAG: type II toxin-antitoxin system PemK/MazF family toxin [Treponema sp.]|nr:type II toxin-antitoxin system PemK/MazF family toxin [Treponema sp.]
MVSQIGVVDKQRIIEKISKLSKSIMDKIENSIVFILGIKLLY